MLPLVAQATIRRPTSYRPGIAGRYLNAHETTLLVSLLHEVRPRVMIEFGCNTGRTAKTVLENVPSLELYIGIDVPPRHRPALACQLTEVPAQAGFHAFDDPRFALLLSDARNLEPKDLEPCDAVFIDGDHSDAAVTHDSKLALALVRPGGIVIWHDYENPAVEVTAALDRLHDQGLAIRHIERTWLAFLKT